MAEEYAKGDSFIYRAHYVQQRRKKRKGGVTPPPVVITRNFVDPLVQALGQRWDASTPVPLVNDWEIEFSANVAVSGTEFIARLAVGSNDIRTLASGRQSFRIVGDTNAHLQGDPLILYTDKKMHTVKLGVRNYVDQLNPGTMYIEIDGSETTMPTPLNPVPLTFSHWGANTNFNSFEGYFSGLKLTVSGTTYEYLLDGTVEVSNGLTMTPINIPAGQISTWTQEGNGDWAQPEIPLDNGFDSPIDWTTGVGWTVAGSKATCDGTQIATSDVHQASTVVEGRQYRASSVVDAVNAGLLSPLVGGAVFTPSISAAGSHDIFGLAGASTETGFQADINFNGTIDSLSVRPYIEVA